MNVPGTDPNTGNILQLIPPGYNFSARIGNNNTGAEAEALRYTYVPDLTSALFIYNYAVVLEDPSHTPAEQPRFEIQVRDQFGNIIPCTFYEVAAGNGIPGFQNFGTTRWKDWTTVGVDLTAYINTPVTIEVRTGDCDLGGHYGYGYVVGDCQPLEIEVTYCLGDTMALLTAPDGFSSYYWSTGQTTQSIVVANPGTQTITCTITSVTGCQATLNTLVEPIDVMPGFLTSTACYQNSQFTDTTNAQNDQIAQWSWDFGDGNTSTAQNPAHTYGAPGTYTVELVATSASGCSDSSTYTVTIEPDPVADFAVPPTCGLDASFTDNSTIAGANAPIVGWQWNFGDGNTSAAQNPTHTYATQGTWNVSLTVTDNAGCTNTLVLPYTNNQYPTAAFTLPGLCGLVNTFTDASTDPGGSIASWQWDFGDGNSSAVQNPTNTYATQGTWDVSLIVTDNAGCTDTITQPYTNNEFPTAAFTLPGLCGLVNGFTDASTDAFNGTIASWQWNFGDGNSSAVQNPTHTYATQGTWNVQLTVTDNAGCSDALTLPFTNDQYPVAAFTPPGLCGLVNDFTDASTDAFGGTIASWQWDFGDGNSSAAQNPTNTYATEGTWNVSLVVTDNAGCTDTIVLPYTNNQFPTAAFSMPGLCGLINSFTDGSADAFGGTVTSWQWDFGDGNSSAAQNPTNTYATEGTWNVNLIVTDNTGCTDTITQSYTNNEFPTAAFTLPGLCGLVNGFTDASTDAFTGTIASWQWDFGDGNNSAAQDPVNTYATEGTYNVTLIVTDNTGCTDTLTQPYTNNEFPVADFILPTNCGLTVTFTDNSSDPEGESIVSWQWDFGDGNNSGAQNPVNTYASQNTWNVELVATDASGCTDTIVQPYNSLELPVAAFTFTNVCDGYPMQFNDQSTAQSAVISGWDWELGDGNSGSVQHPAYNYGGWGDYNVQLVITTQEGCTDTVEHQVSVYPLPQVAFSANDVCLGNTTIFQNSTGVPSGSVSGHIWSFGHPAVGAQSITDPSVVYPGEGTYNVTLVSTTNFGCVDSLTQPVNVWPVPDIDFTAGPLSGCSPMMPAFDNLTVISSGSVTYTWDFGDGGTSAEEDPEYLYPNGSNVYTVTLYAVSDRGCDTSITRPNYITVFPTPEAQFMHDPDYLTVVDNGAQFTNLSVGGTNYYWDFGDGENSNDEHPFHYFPADTGQYPVTLITVNQYGCSDTVMYYMIVKPACTLYVPNTFTPNGDGLNDNFRVSGIGLTDATLLIFDRWGEPLARLEKDQAMTTGWDGQYAGQPVKQDVYVFRLIAKDILGETHELSGKVNLLR